MENQKALKKVSDKDLRKVFLHSLAIMCSWNYERQMHMGFMYGMAPVLDKLYADDEERKISIIEQEGLPSNWKPDEKVLRALEVYKFLTQTTSSLLLRDTRAAIEKARAFLLEMDLSQEDDKGKPKYTINSFVSAVKDIPRLAKEFSEAEAAIVREIEENGRMRANKLKKVGEDGFDSLFTKN